MHDFRKLKVWNDSRELGSEIYKLCADQPRTHVLVTAQLRRSALSVATNIAEGCGKRSRAEVIRYLEIAAGSATETEHHLEVAREVGALPAELCESLLTRAAGVRRMLRALIERFPQ